MTSACSGPGRAADGSRIPDFPLWALSEATCPALCKATFQALTFPSEQITVVSSFSGFSFDERVDFYNILLVSSENLMLSFLAD